MVFSVSPLNNDNPHDPSGSIISYISSSTYKEKEKVVENYIAIRRTDNGDLIRKISETDTNFSSPSLSKAGDRIAYFSKKGHDHFLIVEDEIYEIIEPEAFVLKELIDRVLRYVSSIEIVSITILSL